MIDVVVAAVDGYPRGTDYIRAIARAVALYLSAPHRLNVISDGTVAMPAEIDLREYAPETDRWGWWQLLEIYNPNAPWAGSDVLMFGLDTVIRAGIDWMTGHCSPVFLRPFSDQYGYASPTNGLYADGAVYLPAGEHYHPVWHDSRLYVCPQETHKRKRRWMEHSFVTERLKARGIRPAFWQDVAPGRVCSYKRPKKRLTEPDEAVIFFHGRPRVHEALVEAPWINDYWHGNP